MGCQTVCTSVHTPFIEAREITLAVSTAGEVVGFGHLIRTCKNGNSCEIKGLFVSPHWTRRGVGRSLLRHMEEQAKGSGSTSIGVKSSLNAVVFYEKMGYVVIDRDDMHVCCEQTLQCVSMIKKFI